MSARRSAPGTSGTRGSGRAAGPARARRIRRLIHGRTPGGAAARHRMRAQWPTVARACATMSCIDPETPRPGARALPHRPVSTSETRRAMAQDEDIRIEPFTHAAGGWTSVKEVVHALGEAHIRLDGTRILLKQNKPDGFQCVSCSWAKPAEPHAAEFCEHGAKATAWELTTDRCTPAVLRAAHADGAGRLDRPRARIHRPAHRADALGRGHRQVRGGLLARRVRGHRRGA